MTAVPFDEYIYSKLQDPEFAAPYLKYALEDGGVEEFLIAFHQYMQATGGMARIAKEDDLSPDAVRQILSSTGNHSLPNRQLQEALIARVKEKLEEVDQIGTV